VEVFIYILAINIIFIDTFDIVLSNTLQIIKVEKYEYTNNQTQSLLVVNQNKFNCKLEINITTEIILKMIIITYIK